MYSPHTTGSSVDPSLSLPAPEERQHSNGAITALKSVPFYSQKLRWKTSCGGAYWFRRTAGQSSGRSQGCSATADPVENGADSVHNGADSVHNGADSVEMGAYSVHNGADSVGNGADSVDNGADSVESGADSVHNGADSVGNGANSVETRAYPVENGADSVQKRPTVMDCIQTVNVI